MRYCGCDVATTRDSGTGATLHASDGTDHSAHGRIERLIAAQRCVILDGGTATELDTVVPLPEGERDEPLWGTWALLHGPAPRSSSSPGSSSHQGSFLVWKHLFEAVVGVDFNGAFMGSGSGCERETSHGPEFRAGVRRYPPGERETSHGPEFRAGVRRYPPGERQTSHGPEFRAGVRRYPPGERKTSHDSASWAGMRRFAPAPTCGSPEPPPATRPATSKRS